MASWTGLCRYSTWHDADLIAPLINQVIAQLRAQLPKAEIHPTQADTAAWLGIIQRVKQTMGFILYLCTALAAFSCGALLWIICHQRRQELSILAAYGMPPSQLCSIILSMAGSVAASGIALGLPLAWATLHWREAHTTPALYLTHAGLTLTIVLLSALPAMRLLKRLSSIAPRL